MYFLRTTKNDEPQTSRVLRLRSLTLILHSFLHSCSSCACVQHCTYAITIFTHLSASPRMQVP